MDAIMVWVKFVICVFIIFFAGRRVAKYGDIIAQKTGFGGAWIGVVLIAATTSLPELFTSISATALVKAPDITIGNLFGANTFNLLNLALLDILYRGRPLLTVVSLSHALTGGLSLVLVSLAAAGIIISSSISLLSIGWIGIYTPLLFLLYLVFVRLIFYHERSQKPASFQEEKVAPNYEHMSLRKISFYYSLAAVFIIGAGIWLAFLGSEIAEVTGLGQSFVGSLIIGFSTTLPEITVSFSALRLGAIDMCVGNMVGSNLFNMTIIGVADLFYREGPILSAVSETHVFTALIVVLMTGIFVAGVISRLRRKTSFGITWYGLSLIAVFLLGAYINFSLAQ